MSFNRFIYYCSVCGGWAALLTWALVMLSGVHDMTTPVLKAGLIGALLGAAVAASVGLVDAVQQSPVWPERLRRVAVCAGVGLVGGLLGGTLGDLLDAIGIPLFVGWALTGMAVGASVGVFDVLQARREGREVRLSLSKLKNGFYGGLGGGLVGGLLFWLMTLMNVLPISTLALGLVIVGVSVGLLIGLAQVVLKEAWLQVEVARRPGRQLILTRDEIVIGRAEGCDVGLFGEQGVEKEHARIVRQNNRYLLRDEGTPGGTFLNDVRLSKPAPLKAGDAIRLGGCVLRFHERVREEPAPVGRKRRQ